MTNLKAKRMERGYTQSELAKRAGVDIRIIQHYEQGDRDINKAQVVTVLKLADALECSIRDILN